MSDDVFKAPDEGKVIGHVEVQTPDIEADVKFRKKNVEENGDFDLDVTVLAKNKQPLEKIRFTFSQEGDDNDGPVQSDK
jgi:hypothetical protein